GQHKRKSTATRDRLSRCFCNQFRGRFEQVGLVSRDDDPWPIHLFSPRSYALPRTYFSIALAKPSSVFAAVTTFAACFTLSSDWPIATLNPLFANISTSVGMSPSVAIC